MKNKLAKIALAVLGLAIVLFLSCADNSTLEYPSMDVFFPESSGSETQPGSSSSDGSGLSSSSEDSGLSSSSEGSGLSSSSEGSSVSSSSDGSSSSLSVSSSSGGSGSSSSSNLSISSSSSSLPSCGSEPYNNTQFCHGTTVLFKCGSASSGATYDPDTEDCCGSGKYTKETQFCYNNQPYSKCDGNSFDPPTEDCCNDTKYITAIKYCHDNEVQDKKSCNGELYNDKTHFCYSSSSVGEYCGINPQKSYNPANYGCKSNSNGIYLENGVTDYDGKNYKAVLIGTQVWMAENLNKNVTSSICSNNNCNDRLYTWATAMNLEPRYDSEWAYTASLITSPHQGICPDGWHIPDNADWVRLMKSINPSCTTGSNNADFKSCDLVGKKLRVASWRDGTDDYGFAALPVGTGGSDMVIGTNTLSGWWNATEYNYGMSQGNNVNYMFMDTGTKDSLRVSNYMKSQKFSVRCVKNN